MSTSADQFRASLGIVLSACAELAAKSSTARALDDRALIDAQRAIATARRNLDASSAVLAGEVVARSTVNSGLSGLARREGFRTAEALIQHTTGSTSRDAVTLVRAGTMINDAVAVETAERLSALGGTSEPDTSGLTESWLATVGRAITNGDLSITAAESIRNGLGRPGPGVDASALHNAARTLLDIAKDMTPDLLFRSARSLRDELDADGIAQREQARRAQRSFRRWRKPDGMTRYSWDLDPEGAALVDDIYDAMTSPRRGGPRFVDKDDQSRAESIQADSRTTDQLASDGMLALLRIATDVEDDPRARTVLGRARPAVRVLVSAEDLKNRTGHGWIEGHVDPVSIDTVERITCGAGIVPVVFDNNGQAIDVGREQRLFTRRQRIALAARDGGCRWPGCERPPSWTEAHHIKQWKRDTGLTNLANGILLCRHHHVLLHDNHWEIHQRDSEYWLTPPPGNTITTTPAPMPTKSDALRALTPARAS